MNACDQDYNISCNSLMSKHRAFFGTWNNPKITLAALKASLEGKKEIESFVAQLEKGEQEGTPHF